MSNWGRRPTEDRRRGSRRWDSQGGGRRIGGREPRSNWDGKPTRGGRRGNRRWDSQGDGRRMGGWEPMSNRDGKPTGDRRRESRRWDSQGGGVIGTESLRKTAEEGVGGGIPKEVGAESNREKFCFAKYFAIQAHRSRKHYGRYGKWEVQPPCSFHKVTGPGRNGKNVPFYCLIFCNMNRKPKLDRDNYGRGGIHE